MRTTMPMRFQIEPDRALRRPTSRKSLHPLVQAPLLVLVAAVLLGSGTHAMAAQSPNVASAPAPANKPIHHHKPTAAHSTTSAASPAPAAVTPAAVTHAAPRLPNWPANDKPGKASVTWDRQGLRINAANSSLQQILKDVSTATGAKFEGMGSDERVFGAYGPGQARDVLSQLLQGSGYNVMMIGDQGQGTPRQVVLSARQSGDSQPAGGAPASNPDEDADVDEQPQPPPQPPIPPFRPGFPPGGPIRTPQQALQERQEQQQQQLQQQQQQQQQSPGNPPN